MYRARRRLCFLKRHHATSFHKIGRATAPFRTAGLPSVRSPTFGARRAFDAMWPPMMSEYFPAFLGVLEHRRALFTKLQSRTRVSGPPLHPSGPLSLAATWATSTRRVCLFLLGFMVSRRPVLRLAGARSWRPTCGRSQSVRAYHALLSRRGGTGKVGSTGTNAPSALSCREQLRAKRTCSLGRVTKLPNMPYCGSHWRLAPSKHSRCIFIDHRADPQMPSPKLLVRKGGNVRPPHR